MTIKNARELRIVMRTHQGIELSKLATVIHSVPRRSAHQPASGEAEYECQESTRSARKITYRTALELPQRDIQVRPWTSPSSIELASAVELLVLGNCTPS